MGTQRRGQSGKLLDETGWAVWSEWWESTRKINGEKQL